MRISDWSSDVCSSDLAKLSDQKQLRNNRTELLLSGNNGNAASAPFEITMLNFDEEMQGVTINNQATLSAACQSRWGHNCHVAGAITEDAGCLIVMRSKKEDDTSKPLLEAMRKAATPFSADHRAIGRASCRERVCQSVKIEGVAV